MRHLQSAKKAVYVNKKQAQFLNARQKVKVFIGGRGSGKSTLAGFHIYQLLAMLPRSKGFILGLTYNQILTIFLPPILSALESMGIYENIHYVIGRRPPQGFAEPFQKVKNFENLISFFNGMVIQLISFDRKDVNRGGNNDWGVIDEAVLINQDRYSKELDATIRGNTYKYPASSYLHHSRIYLSSQSWLSSGDWVPDMSILAEQHPNDFFYIEGTAYDNIDAVGKSYVDNLRRTMSSIIFDVEVLNKRRSKLPNCFYDEFNADKHCYYESYSYSTNDAGIYVENANTDYNPKVVLELSFDFNAAFNSCVAAQEGSNVLRFINNFFVKNKTITHLVELIINHYRGHQAEIWIWGDRNGNNKQANSELTYFEQIRQQFIEAGFSVVVKVGEWLDPEHKLKHHTINTLLSERNAGLPSIRFNQLKCKYLIMSIEGAPVNDDFKKDKRSEKDLSLDQEKATHLSDAFDCIVYHKYKGKVNSNSPTYRVRFS